MAYGKAIVTAAYVVPLLAVSVGLIAIGDVAIAVALLVVEVVVATSIVLVGRGSRVPRGERPPPRIRAAGDPVLGLPGEDSASGRAVALAAIGLVGMLVVLGLVIALLSSQP